MDLSGLTSDGVYKRLSKLDSFVGFLPEIGMRMVSMKQADQYSLELGCHYCGYEVTIPGQEDCFLNRLFGS